MKHLYATLSPSPSTWTGNNFCKWEGIKCDNSNRVTAINLRSKSLTGTLPPDINNLTHLETLAVQHNSISGDIPTMANLARLQLVHLNNNNFTSFPSTFFTGLNNLHFFSVSDNPNLAPWHLPENLYRCFHLKRFDATNANIVGKIPDVFYRLHTLQTLRLSYNDLTGTLPQSFAGSQIRVLHINNQVQGLSGSIDVLSLMTRLNEAWLDFNLFTGVIPDLSNCTDLYDLQLRNNEFRGLVPESLMNLPKIGNISMQNNLLQGPLPVFKSVVHADLGADNNSFCLPKPGPCDPQVNILLEIARSFGYPMLLAKSWKGNDACLNWGFVSCDLSEKNVTNLSFLNLNFSGFISPAFANLTALKILSLGNNNLSGPIPKILTSLPDLQLLDVSNNNLSGEIPMFSHKVKFLHSGNPFLGNNEHDMPSRKTKWVLILVGTASVIILVIMGFLCIPLRFNLRNNQCPGEVPNPNETGNTHPEMSVFEDGVAVISFQVVQQATNDFSDENVLGEGSFGVVYKGELVDGTKIAVKRMNSGETKGTHVKDFETEVTVLKTVRHRHLVNLVGYCINDNERLLVYEYMSQGTLSQRLFEWEAHKTDPLSWKQRVLIGLDVARGLEYLHGLGPTNFIHRDLKSSNILLDDHLRAKVADFGLVKYAPDGTQSVETRVAGTFGYVAPEYASTGRVSTKVDVYAFGTVLMEMLTGRKAMDNTKPEDEKHLVTWFHKDLTLKEDLMKVIDPTLDTNEEKTVENIYKVGLLAAQCTKRDRHQRPDMGHVVFVLGSLVEQWEPPRIDEDEGNGDDVSNIFSQLKRKLQTGEGTSGTTD
ncbi:hypothetical protein E3N88_32566 [Mikania micrantha]|uniref:Protein kinase domain-containing protein n=1 Tax=Mikania micrantha TaxID=192012 RepID=A0A5N6M9E3_9ASTR|nr:hypothetical protein E3N88_32566 [Mikania micrantha]